MSLFNPNQLALTHLNLMFNPSKTLHEEKGMSKVWDGFREKRLCERLKSSQVDCGRKYVHQTEADGFVWDRIVAGSFVERWTLIQIGIICSRSWICYRMEWSGVRG